MSLLTRAKTLLAALLLPLIHLSLLTLFVIASGLLGSRDRAVVWADGSIPAEGDPNQMVIAGKVLFERDRTAKSGLTAYVSHRYIGASKAIDLCGVSIVTDA
jgi:hypothetical protein